MSTGPHAVTHVLPACPAPQGRLSQTPMQTTPRVYYRQAAAPRRGQAGASGGRRGCQGLRALCGGAQGAVEADPAARAQGQTCLLAEAHQQSVDLPPQLPVKGREVSVGGTQRGAPPPPTLSHRGSHSSRAARVFSGDVVVVLVHRSLLAILCTCVSTAGGGSTGSSRGTLTGQLPAHSPEPRPRVPSHPRASRGP